MKLLYVTARFPFGPGEAFVMPELSELLRLGHELLIVPAWPCGRVVHDDARPFLRNTLAISILSPRVMFGAFVAFLLHPRMVIELILVLASVKGWKLKLKNLALLPKGAWLANEANKWKADHIHSYWCSTGASMAMVAAKISGTPWSFTGHRSDIVDRNLIPQKAESAEFVRFISQIGLEMSGLKHTHLESKASVLHVGISLPQISARENAPNPNPLVVLCPANLIPVKGHEYLISAIELLRNSRIPVKLLLAGDGPLRSHLQHMVRLAGLDDAVSFLGHIPHSALMNLFSTGAVHVVALPSVDAGHGVHEAIPVSLMEAMGFGIPVVSTATGGIPELLGDTAGIVVRPRDAGELANALRLLAERPALGSSLGRAGRMRVEAQFSVSVTVANLVRKFERAHAIPAGAVEKVVDLHVGNYQK